MQLFRDIIILTPFYISFLWGLIFIVNTASDNKPRYALGIFMLTASVVYFTHAAFFKHYYDFYLKIDGLYMFASLSVYPLYFIYISLLTRDKDFKSHYLWHLAPAVILAILFEVLSTFATPEARDIYLKDVLFQNTFPSGGSPLIVSLLASVFFFSRIVFGLQTIAYLVLGVYFIKKYNERIANFYANLSDKKIVWLELLNITLIVAAVSSFLLNIVGRHFFEEENLLYIPSVIFSILLFIIGLLGNKQKQTIVEVQEDEISDIDLYEEPENQNLLKEKLVAFMEKEKPFLNPNFRITDLSPKLFTNRTYLSQLINTEFKMSFSDFVNRYRIQHAKTLMDKDMESNYSLNYFSEQSGFGSVSSFIRAFKQVEGVTAGTYHKQTKIAS